MRAEDTNKAVAMPRRRTKWHENGLAIFKVVLAVR
jgi:hypothetical protein